MDLDVATLGGDHLLKPLLEVEEAGLFDHGRIKSSYLLVNPSFELRNGCWLWVGEDLVLEVCPGPEV